MAPAVSAGIRTRSYRLQPPGLKDSKRSIGGRFIAGSAKVISSPVILSQSPVGLVRVWCSSFVEFCSSASAFGLVVPVAKMVSLGTIRPG